MAKDAGYIGVLHPSTNPDFVWHILDPMEGLQCPSTSHMSETELDELTATST